MEQLITKVEAGIGWITLNRPDVLNALSFNMIREIATLLDAWEADPAVRLVVIQGAGEKAFCAGGDVRSLREDHSLKDAIFREEYTLNTHMHEYAKPCIILINGIAMGGGLGVSVNGSHRIVTERAHLAMPETAIGFFPDVGATTFLNNAPGFIGLYLGLTGTSFKANDALWTGIATHYIPSSTLPQFIKDICEDVPFQKILEIYQQHPVEKGFLEHHQEQIDSHFHHSSLQDIMESLKGDPSPFAQNTYNTLMSKSPMSLAVTFRQLKYEGPPLSFQERMKMEFRLSQRFVEGHDFMEGVRALLVDKDKRPRWEPATIAEIKSSDVDAYFATLGDKELEL